MKEKYKERKRENRRERETRVEESLEIWALRCISASEDNGKHFSARTPQISR